MTNSTMLHVSLMKCLLSNDEFSKKFCLKDRDFQGNLWIVFSNLITGIYQFILHIILRILLLTTQKNCSYLDLKLNLSFIWDNKWQKGRCKLMYCFSCAVLLHNIHGKRNPINLYHKYILNVPFSQVRSHSWVFV